MSLNALAFDALPEAGQRAIIDSGDNDAQCILSASPLTSQKNIELLTQNKHEYVRQHAYMYTENVEMLREIFSRYLARSLTMYHPIHAVRNPLVPEEILAQMLNDTNRNVIFGAYCNPSTPEETRRKLTPVVAMQITGFGDEDESYKNLQAAELVLANPWMAETAARWSHPIQHAIHESPYTPEAIAETLTATLCCEINCLDSAFWPRHRVQGGWDYTTNTKFGIKETGADLRAIGKDDFNEDDALALLNRQTLPMPQVIGRLVNRFGGVLLLKSGNLENNTDNDLLELCSVVAPTLKHIEHSSNRTHLDIASACNLLGENDENWGAYVALLRDWYSSYTEAALAVGKL